MRNEPDLAADLLQRSIDEQKRRLAIARAANNTRLVSRVQRNLERLLNQQQKMTKMAAEKPSRRKKSKRRAKVGRPTLKDESTVVRPHGKRWTELVGYVGILNEHFPTEYLVDRCGMFSTEREFARYIRELESRIGDKE